MGRSALSVATLCGVLALVASGCGSHRTVAVAPAPRVALSQRTQLVQFGSILSLAPLGTGYAMRFDLHLLLNNNGTGIKACTDSRQCPPGTSDFPDDIFDHDFRYVLTLRLLPNARIMLVNGDVPVRVTSRQLYELARGVNPERLHLGSRFNSLWFYIEYSDAAPTSEFDPVTRVEQFPRP